MANPVRMKPRSFLVTDGPDRAPNRGMLRALGMDDDDFSKPQIGIANSYNRITPCNMSLRDVAVSVAQGVEAGGGFPMEFGTITVSDVISMGHEGSGAPTDAFHHGQVPLPLCGARVP